LLDALPVACPECNGRHQRGNLARHIQLCPKRTAHAAHATRHTRHTRLITCMWQRARAVVGRRWRWLT
jgi:hypothetical protein